MTPALIEPSGHLVAPPPPAELGDRLRWDMIPDAPSDAPTSVSELDLEPRVGLKYTPSPEDWRDEVMYSVIVDRFSRRGPCSSWGDPADGRTRHGGNLRGLIDRLDYLRMLGVTVLQINPLYLCPVEGYHQYWAVNFLAVDPQIGTMDDARRLVAEAHRRGIRVVLDMVFNHVAPLIEYAEGFSFGPRKTIRAWRHPLMPVELADERHFSLRGDISDWHDPEQLRVGDLPGGVNRLDTDNPETQDILLKIAKWWLRETDADGYRLDVYKHVSGAFWTRFFREIREYASGLGKENFLLLGELYDGNPLALQPEVAGGRLDSAYNYPAYYWDREALHGQAPTRSLESNFVILQTMFGDALGRMVNFLDNHDRPRFLGPDEPEGVLRFALAATMLAVGIPYLYYGDEQAFRRVPERDWLDLESSRDDMFADGHFQNPGRAGSFDPATSMFSFVSSLARVRKALAPLRRGRQYVRWSDPHGPGVYAFSRILGEQEVLVVLNSSGERRTARMCVDRHLSPSGAELIDALDSGYRTAVESGADCESSVAVEVPPYGARVLTRAA